MRKLESTRWQAIIGLIVAVVLLGSGLVIQQAARSTDKPTMPTSETRGTATYETEVQRVELRGLYAGDITLTPSGSGDKVEVRNSGTENGDLKLITSVKDGKLIVTQSGDCVVINQGAPCNARFTVYLPRNAAVMADSAGAALTIERLQSDVDVSNAAGLTLKDVSGRLKVQSSTGAIKGSGLTSGQVDARALSGPIDLTFTKAPRLVDVRSDNGDATVRLPRESSYKVVADAPNGTRTVNVKTAQDDAYQVKALSSSGSVTISN